MRGISETNQRLEYSIALFRLYSARVLWIIVFIHVLVIHTFGKVKKHPFNSGVNSNILCTFAVKICLEIA